MAPAVVDGGAGLPHSWLVLLKLRANCTEQLSALKSERPSSPQREGINTLCLLFCCTSLPSIPQKGAQAPRGQFSAGDHSQAAWQGLDGPFTHLFQVPSMPLLLSPSPTGPFMKAGTPQRWVFPPEAPS